MAPLCRRQIQGIQHLRRVGGKIANHPPLRERLLLNQGRSGEDFMDFSLHRICQNIDNREIALVSGKFVLTEPAQQGNCPL